MKSSEYVNQERREYSLYVLEQRAIPHASDGLRSASRRVLWTAKNGDKIKSATLAGATIPIHPHAAPEGSVNTLASPFTNNIPLLNGIGSFGTILKPTAYGASRYTSVKVSKFCKDVVFRDIEIIPMQDNYDGTLREPKHFLPLIPVALLNPQSGTAVGFASTILPRALPDIIKNQLAILEGKAFTEEPPALEPIDQRSIGWVDTPKGWKATFCGAFERTGATELKITNLPYGTLHERYRVKLDKWEDEGIIQSYKDRSKDKYNIDVKFKRGVLNKLDDQGILEMLDLVKNISENLVVINFDGTTVWPTTYEEFIIKFTEWRAGWYKNRYQRLADLQDIDNQKCRDILLAIKKNVGKTARDVASRAELKELLKALGIVHVDYISDLPVYRFTQEEKTKTEARLKDGERLLAEYKDLLRNPSKRRMIYLNELKEVLANYKRGTYGN